ncbi:MAG: 6,7-dimethyl-8-ribityllumazine synthase [Candidatus Kryptoniota bacterium]
MNSFEGKLDGSGLKIAIAVSRFNGVVTDRLLNGAEDALIRHGVNTNDIDVYRCPGAFELPAVAGKLCSAKKYDAVICLGAVVRGETPHFDYIAGESAKGIGQLSISSEIPVIYGILTTDSLEQAIDRAGGKIGNKGFDAAVAAIEMVQLFRHIKLNR